MILFHGTSKESLDSILKHGIRMGNYDEYKSRVCAMDSLEKAKKVAAYFGQNGVVLVIDVPDHLIEYHPDYGYGPEFDTIYIKSNVPPNRIIKIINTPTNVNFVPRPAGMPLRKWKSEIFNKKLTEALENLFGKPNANYD